MGGRSGARRDRGNERVGGVVLGGMDGMSEWVGGVVQGGNEWVGGVVLRDGWDDRVG